MSFKVMLILCTFSLAYSFPADTKVIDERIIPKNVTSQQKFEDGSPHFTLRVRDTKSENSTDAVEFINKNQDENSETGVAGTDREKYFIHTASKQENETSLLHNISNGTMKMEKYIPNQYREDEKLHKSSTRKPNSNLTTIIKMEKLTGHNKIPLKKHLLFVPQEFSSITGGWPKYFYDIFHPISPFPESENSAMLLKAKTFQNTVRTLPKQQTTYKKPKETAGPLLYPSTIYNTEIDVPFFD